VRTEVPGGGGARRGNNADRRWENRHSLGRKADCVREARGGGLKQLPRLRGKEADASKRRGGPVEGKRGAKPVRNFSQHGRTKTFHRKQMDRPDARPTRNTGRGDRTRRRAGGRPGDKYEPQRTTRRGGKVKYVATNKKAARRNALRKEKSQVEKAMRQNGRSKSGWGGTRDS